MWGGGVSTEESNVGTLTNTGEPDRMTASYIGETVRPWRERVREHQLNLRNGNHKSFIISHWLEAHPMSVEAPEFEWNVVDAYGDALRHHLCEGLQIMEAGSLNKRLEFHNNIICRMRVSASDS